MYQLQTETTTTDYPTYQAARDAQLAHPERLGSSIVPAPADGDTVTLEPIGPAGGPFLPTTAPEYAGALEAIAPARPVTPAPVDGVTVRKLSGANVDALKAAQSVGLEVTTTATTATFPGTVRDALEALESATESLAARHGRRGHPVQSLHAVRRRLERL